MKKCFFAFLIAITTENALSQNLVPDGSFEIDTACPQAGNVNYNLYWTNPTGGTPDYFDTCSSSWVNSVPNNFVGSQNAFGGAYVGMITGIFGDFREYVQVRLLDSLQAGISYCASFYVSLAGGFSAYATNAPQLYFSDSAISSTGTSNFPYIPQINNTAIVADTTNWTLITGTYTANGGEKFITIGNFYPDSNTPNVVVDQFNGLFAYYYVDNVTVVQCDSASSVDELSNASSLILFPNPSTGKFYLRGVSNGEVEIHNTLGAKVFTAKIISFNQEIDFSEQPKGVYFVRVLSDEGIQIQKVILE